MALVLSCALVACDKAGTDKTGTDIAADYKVTIHPNNGQGDIVWDITKEIPTITKDGFHIAGYFLDAQLTISTTLESLKATGITKNIDVYVKWEEHVEATDAAVAPTCTEKGLTEGKHCSKCGKILKAQTEIDALGHDLENHDGQEATCTEKGWKAYVTCKREGCDHTTYEEIPALGHIGGTATCTEQAVCERCNEKYGNALGHNYGDLIPKTEPTCSATGTEAHYKCSVCNKVFKEDELKTETTLDDLTIAINPTAHNFGNWIKNEGADTHTRVCSFNSEHTETENCHGGTATCTEQAVCEKCNAKYGKALGHNYQGGVCTRCGTERASEGLEYSLNSDGNGYTVTGIGTCTDTELVIPSKHNSKPVTSIGYEAFRGCTGLTSITIPNSVTNIDYAFSNCRNLSNIYYTGDIKGWCEIDGLRYLMRSSYGSYTHTLYIDGIKVEGDLVIPDSVTSIGDGAFLGCTGLTSITIPNRVTSIGDDAFYGCSRLTNITIPDSVTNIGMSAFDNTAWYYSQPYYGTIYLGKVAYGYKGIMPDNTTITLKEGTLGIAEGAFSRCDGLTNIILPDGLITIGDSAFGNGLTSIVIPNSVTTLGDYAFSGCKNLTSVTIGNGVTSLGDGVFESCKSLTSITIPASVTNISLYAFPFCSGLKNINVAKGNPKYHSNGNCLIETESKTLVLGCQTSVIPTNGSVTKIGDVSFWGCESLTNISIPDCITSIGIGAFVYCKGLTSITIPASVTSIADNAFLGCSGLSSITVAKNNAKYHSDGNCLIDTENKTLMSGCKNSIIPSDGSVTSIGYYAFYNCTGLTSITIPDSVTSIDKRAFSGCTGLTSVTIPGSVTSIGYYAFYNCTGLTSITIPDSVTSIDKRAFSGCTGLTSVTIPGSVTSIGEYAFAGCYKLVEVYNKSSLSITAGSEENGYVAYYAKNIYTEEGKSKLTTDENGYVIYTDGDEKILVAYLGTETELTLPAYITQIYNYAFRDCTGLTSVTIPNSVTSIGSEAFDNCTGLTSIEIPDSVTSIGYDTFYGCTELTSITGSATNVGTVAKQAKPTSFTVNITSGTSISDSAFRDCTGLTSITIPDSVTSIGNYAFQDCYKLQDIYITGIAAWCNISGLDNLMRYGTSNKNLYINNELATSITIPNGVTAIPSSAFRGCTGLMSITIGNGVTSIGSSAFSGCTNLTSISIPDSVTSIGNSAFSGCSGLTSIKIPDNVTSIGDNAFAFCTGLTSVIIGSGVTSIGNSAFSGCSGLTSIKIPDNVTSIGDSAFSGCSSLETITIPFVGASETASKGYDQVFGYIFGYTTSRSSSSVSGATYQYYDGFKYYHYYIPSSIKSVIITRGNIQSYAFKNCTGLTSITIPDSVTSIGKYAFYGCTGLASIIVEDGNAKYHSDGNCLIETESKTLIFGCKTSVIPSDGSVTSIGSEAFYNCTGLTSIEIPDNVTSIGDNAFAFCTGLTSVIIGSGVTSIGEYAFGGCIGLASIYYTGDVAGWCGISGLDSLMSSSLTLYISDKKVEGELIIPDSVTSIGNSAFDGCTGLTSVVIPNSVTSIGHNAFYGCSGLTSITIPDSVTSIGNGAFWGCTGLTSIIVENGNAKYHSDGNCLIETESKTLIFGCKTSVIPSDGSVTSIGSEAFYNCTGLTSVTIGNGVTNIGGYAFYGCSGLTSITIPGSVTSIGEGAFVYCTGLTSVTIPDSVTSIGVGVFAGCTGLSNIKFNGTIAQWNAISKGSYWKDSVPATQVVCKDGTTSI